MAKQEMPTAVWRMVIIGIGVSAGMGVMRLAPGVVHKAIDNANSMPPAPIAAPQTNQRLEDENTTALAQAITTSGLRDNATVQAARKTFFTDSNNARAPELASATTSKLAAMGHSEYTLTLPPGENRILIRNNTTGKALSMNFANH
jgi:hypothetical protein